MAELPNCETLLLNLEGGVLHVTLNRPDSRNAMSLTITMGHDPSNVNYQTMLDISRTLSKVAFKLVLSGGATAYGYGYMSVSEFPQMSKGQANQVNAAITFLGRFISYAS